MTTTQEEHKKLILLDPRAEADIPEAALAPRVATLDGLRVGLLANAKHNADLLLDDIYELIAERYEPAGAVRAAKKDGSAPAPPALLDELAETCDVVITAVGD